MNIFALLVTLSLNCCATRPKQTKTPLALAVTMAQNEYYPLSPPFLKAVKGHLSRLVGVLLVVHALPQVVTPAKCSSLSEKLQRARVKRKLNARPVKRNAKQVATLVSRDD